MLKIVGTAALFIVASAGIASACTVADFSVERFKVGSHDLCQLTPCPIYALTGFLKNNCTQPAAAEIKITALDKSGDVVTTTTGWPASVKNIAPGERFSFDLGPLITYDPAIDSFTYQVVDARTW